MLLIPDMRATPTSVSTPGMQVLLIEVNSDARATHRATLAGGGYSVTPAEAWPPLTEIGLSAIVISDVVSFRLLQDSGIRRLPPVVVLADDARAGVSACLCGATAWVPTRGDDGYLLATIDELVRPHKLAIREPTNMPGAATHAGEHDRRDYRGRAACPCRLLKSLLAVEDGLRAADLADQRMSVDAAHRILRWFVMKGFARRDQNRWVATSLLRSCCHFVLVEGSP